MHELSKHYDRWRRLYRSGSAPAIKRSSAIAKVLLLPLLLSSLSICSFNTPGYAQCNTVPAATAPVTVDDEATTIPNSRQLVNGTNSTVDTSTPGQVKIDVSSPAALSQPITVDNETSTYPNSRQLVNGTNSTVDTSTAGQIKIDVSVPSSGSSGTVPGGRLSFSATLAVPTSDITSASTIYYLPYTSLFISLDNGTSLITDNIGTSGISASLSATSGAVYDVFVYDNSGTPALHFVQWTNTTTRATALTPDSLGGFLVLSGSGNEIYRYVGSFYATSSNTSQDEAANRALFNMYNRVDRSLVATGLSATWTNSSGTWGSADSNTTNGQGRVSFLVGYVDYPASLAFTVNVHGGASPSANSPCLTGVGLNSTSSPAASSTTPGFSDSANASSFSVPLTANFLGQPALGYNYLQALVNSLSSNLTFNEYGTGTGQTGNMVMVGSAQL